MITQVDPITASVVDPFVSYAQNFEDIMLWRALCRVKKGFYIDVGAAEPETYSVTRAFYERGWRGVNIEPLPRPFALLSKARPRDINLNSAVGAAPGEAILYAVGEENGLSTLVPELAENCRKAGWATRPVRVPIATLAEICAKHVHDDLHFLKVDVEGAELKVLRGADFKRWRPWIVLLEAPAPDSFLPQPEQWETEVLGPAGYLFAWFDGLNRFYIAKERDAELRPYFRAPPNVFDGFIRRTEVELTERLNDAFAVAAAVQVRAETAEEGMATAERRAAEVDARANATALALRRTESERDAFEQKVSEASRHIARLSEERQSMLQQMEELKTEIARQKDWINAIYASTSWKFARPIRAARKFVNLISGRR